METVVEVDGRAGLLEHLRKLLAPYPTAPPVTDATVRVKAYCYDPRIEWHTYMVILQDYGPIGYTDGPSWGQGEGRPKAP
jgi:hypothetical protein